MKRLASGLVVALLGSATLGAQERDRSLERISMALQQTPTIVEGVARVTSDFPKRLGPITLVQPIKRGEMIRVSFPIGEVTMRAFRSVAAANYRRKEGAARRQVEAELKQLQQATRPTPDL